MPDQGFTIIYDSVDFKTLLQDPCCGAPATGDPVIQYRNMIMCQYSTVFYFIFGMSLHSTLDSCKVGRFTL